MLTIYAHGGYDYTANRNVTEAGVIIDSFTYTVSDDNGGTTTATLQITITDVPNNPPTIEAQTTSPAASLNWMTLMQRKKRQASQPPARSPLQIWIMTASVFLSPRRGQRAKVAVFGALTATVDNDTMATAAARLLEFANCQ